MLPGSAESKLWSQPTPFMKKETKVNKHNVVFQFSLIDFFTMQFARLHFIQLEVHWPAQQFFERNSACRYFRLFLFFREKKSKVWLQLSFIAWDWENPRFLFISWWIVLFYWDSWVYPTALKWKELFFQNQVKTNEGTMKIAPEFKIASWQPVSWFIYLVLRQR